mgnify:CR=1 FL=1
MKSIITEAKQLPALNEKFIKRVINIDDISHQFPIFCENLKEASDAFPMVSVKYIRDYLQMYIDEPEASSEFDSLEEYNQLLAQGVFIIKEMRRLKIDYIIL